MFFSKKKKKKDNQQQNEPIVKKNGDEAIADIDETVITEKDKKGSLLAKFKSSLSRTRQEITGKIDGLVRRTSKIDEEFWEELEEILIQADVGFKTTLELVDRVRDSARKNKVNEATEVVKLLKEEVKNILQYYDQGLNTVAETPMVILVVGVNGAGKTTSIAKLAHKFKQENKKTMLAAGDTFRAAAIDQLQIWADRVGVELIKNQEGSDPGAVVFDAINAARARKAEVLIIDTAGRLQNKTNLMKELAKISKIVNREIEGAPHEVLLVLDATTGQNAISQARIFKEATGVTGIILTKMDGTAKGGIVLAVAQELNIPVKLIGMGEGMEDLNPFVANNFVEALFEE